MKSYLAPGLAVILFASLSLPLFWQVYKTTQMVIDEQFHLRQGLHYCNKEFNVWDNKITTFPGLYLFALILIPLDFCNVLGLRLISLVGGIVNVVLLYVIRRRNLGNVQSALAALEAFTIAILPPMYFFNHLYYSDTLSLTTVLLFYIFWQKGNHLPASVYAAASVLMRQTNVAWVGMAFGTMALDIVTVKYAEFKGIKPKDVRIYKPEVVLDILKSFNLLMKCCWHIFTQGCFYLVIILPFLGFVYLNGSIVVGDKSAHEASMHVPQLFYFSVYCLIFAISNTITKFRATIKALMQWKSEMIMLTIVFLLIVRFNTLIHPYLLADNRHYIFYVWTRFYGRYWWFKYCMCPVYAISLMLVHQGIRHLRFPFKFMFCLATLLVLCFQRLLDLRYFIIPYVIFRLNTRPNLQSKTAQWVELAFYVALNFITFYLFFTKEIMWHDFKEPQRLIW